MARPHRWLCLLPFVLAVAPRPAASQVGTTTDILTGTVTGPDSQPLAAAIVQVTSVETRVSRQRTTDAHGRFTIVFPDGGGRYELTARFIGMAPVQITVARQADRSEEHTSELQSPCNLVCRLLLEKKKKSNPIYLNLYTICNSLIHA